MSRIEQSLARLSQGKDRQLWELEALALSVIGALGVYSPKSAGAFRERLQKINSIRKGEQP